jgi:hypothetical protein
MNRLAVHQSLVHPLTPLQLIDLLRETGWDSLGLHIGAVDETEPWWVGGAGEQLLAATVDRLLETRVTVLDVGRVRLGASLERDDVHRAHGRVLDFGARLGAQFVTTRFEDAPGKPPTTAERAARFTQLAEQARPFRLRPLLSSSRAGAGSSWTSPSSASTPTWCRRRSPTSGRTSGTCGSTPVLWSRRGRRRRGSSPSCRRTCRWSSAGTTGSGCSTRTGATGWCGCGPTSTGCWNTLAPGRSGNQRSAGPSFPCCGPPSIWMVLRWW